MSLQHEAHTDGHSTSNGKNLIDGHIHTNGHNSTDGEAWSKGHASSTHGHSPTNGHNSTGDMANTNGHYQDDVQSNPALASASAPLEKPLQIIRRALRSLPYVPPGTTRDLELRRAARQLLDDLGDRGDELIAKFFDVGMWCAELFYPSAPAPTKTLLGVQTILTIAIDDCAPLSLTAHQSFQRNVLLGLPHATPHLQVLANSLPLLYDHYPPFTADAMISSLHEFVGANVLEHRIDSSTTRLSPSATDFPPFFRAQTGVLRYYSLAAFPGAVFGPDAELWYVQAEAAVGEFLALGNDVLSFPKEEMDGETGNYMHCAAATEGVHVHEMLERCAGRAFAASGRAVDVLGGAVGERGDAAGRDEEREKRGKAQEAVRELEAGFVAFHLSLARYRFSEEFVASLGEGMRREGGEGQ